MKESASKTAGIQLLRVSGYDILEDEGNLREIRVAYLIMVDGQPAGFLDCGVALADGATKGIARRLDRIIRSRLLTKTSASRMVKVRASRTRSERSSKRGSANLSGGT